MKLTKETLDLIGVVVSLLEAAETLAVMAEMSDEVFEDVVRCVRPSVHPLLRHIRVASKMLPSTIEHDRAREQLQEAHGTAN